MVEKDRKEIMLRNKNSSNADEQNCRKPEYVEIVIRRIVKINLIHLSSFHILVFDIFPFCLFPPSTLQRIIRTCDSSIVVLSNENTISS